MIRIIDSKDAGRLLKRRQARLTEAENTVRPILEAVRSRGDAALLEYARQFDGLTRRSVMVPAHELKSAESRLSREFRQAVKTAAANIRAYSKLQLPAAKTVTPAPGLKLSQIVRPLDSVAAYIPSGRYPLPSTVMMTVIPAKVAGVATVMVATPKPVDEIFGTASMLGATHVFEMGGAQAIAAFAFGTKTVPKADRIVGPGNIYVAAAKKLLAGEVGIDFIAGPTEILIISSDGEPRWLAADMLAQAEHDTDASAVLLTTSKRLALAVAKEVERQLEDLPTAPTARVAIEKNSAIVVVQIGRGSAGIVQPVCAGAPQHSRSEAARRSQARRQRVCGLDEPGGRGRLRLGAQSRPADVGRGAAEGRAVGYRLRQGDFGPAIEPGSARKAAAFRIDPGTSGGARSACAFGGGSHPWLTWNLAPQFSEWRRTRRPRRGAAGNCAWISTRTPWVARRG